MAGAPDHTARAHAVLSPSGAHRWMECGASVRAQAPFPDQAGEAAAHGTAAHELADRCGQAGVRADMFLGDVIAVGDREFTVDAEMVDGVNLYLDTIRGDALPGDEIEWEQRYALDPFLPGQFGTSDNTLYRPSARLLRVTDLKFGAGVPVDAVGNWQLVCYAIGALMAASRPVVDVEMVIVQPRAYHADGPVRRWRISAVELMELAGDLQRGGERALSPDAPAKAGDWCRWCKASGVCPTLAMHSLTEAQMVFRDDPPKAETLNAEQVGRLLHSADTMEEWLRSIRSHAMSELLAGREVPGWKLVQKRGRRQWADPDGAEAALRAEGLADDDIYTRSMLSPAQAEKALGRGKSATVAPFIESVSGGLTMAPAGDKRPAVAATPHADVDFAAIFGAQPLP